jgi:hypothetical protein
VPEEGVPLYRRRGEEKGERTWTLLTTITPIKRQLPVTAVFKVISYQIMIDMVFPYIGAEERRRSSVTRL